MVGRQAGGRCAVGRHADSGQSRLQQGVSTGGLVEVLPDGVVVHSRGQRHKHVPDGVGEGDDAVALEEEDAQAVDEPAAGQLVEALCVALRGRGTILFYYIKLSLFHIQLEAKRVWVHMGSFTVLSGNLSTF